MDRRRRRQFWALSALMLLSTAAELISLGAVLPFLSILSAPDVAFQNSVVANIARRWNLSSPDQLVLPLTLAFALAALAAGVIRVMLLWFSTRLAFATGADLSLEAYRRTLYQ